MDQDDQSEVKLLPGKRRFDDVELFIELAVQHKLSFTKISTAPQRRQLGRGELDVEDLRLLVMEFGGDQHDPEGWVKQQHDKLSIGQKYIPGTLPPVVREHLHQILNETREAAGLTTRQVAELGNLPVQGVQQLFYGMGNYQRLIPTVVAVLGGVEDDPNEWLIEKAKEFGLLKPDFVRNDLAALNKSTARASRGRGASLTSDGRWQMALPQPRLRDVIGQKWNDDYARRQTKRASHVLVDQPLNDGIKALMKECQWNEKHLATAIQARPAIVIYTVNETRDEKLENNPDRLLKIARAFAVKRFENPDEITDGAAWIREHAPKLQRSASEAHSR